jgi:hypothetical protein
MNGDRISDTHVGQIFLINVDQHPHAADVGDHEALGRADLKKLACGYILLDDQAADRCLHRNLE